MEPIFSSKCEGKAFTPKEKPFIRRNKLNGMKKVVPSEVGMVHCEESIIVQKTFITFNNNIVCNKRRIISNSYLKLFFTKRNPRGHSLFLTRIFIKLLKQKNE